MGWTPQTVMLEAFMRDFADAYEGYMEFNGKVQEASLPAKEFMREMMKRFPDQ